MNFKAQININSAVILASGKGNRLRNDKYHCSKPMTPICGKPLITYSIDALISCGVKNIVVVYGESSIDILQLSSYSVAYKNALVFAKDTKQTGKLTAFNCANGLVEAPFVTVYGDVVVRTEDFSNMIEYGLNLCDNHPDLVVETVNNPSILSEGAFEKPILAKDGRIIKWIKEGAVIDKNIKDCDVKAGGMIYLWYNNPFPLVANSLLRGQKKYSIFLEEYVPNHNVFEMPIKDIWDVDRPEIIALSETILCKG